MDGKVRVKLGRTISLGGLGSVTLVDGEVRVNLGRTVSLDAGGGANDSSLVDGKVGVKLGLHCLKRVKQYLHPDYYAAELNVYDDLFEHLDHCLESLRLTIMCHADTHVYALEWLPQNRFKPGVILRQPNVCVDWDPLHQWMLERAARVDAMEKPPPELFDEYDRTHRGQAGKGKSVY